MSPDKEPRLGDLLIKEGLVTEADIKKVLAHQKSQGKYVPFGDACVVLKLITQSDLNRVLDKYKKRIKIGDLLINLDLITPDELKVALDEQKASKARLGDILVKNEKITEESLIDTLSVQMGIPKIKPDVGLIDKSLLKMVKETFLKQNEVIPAFREGNTITAIMSDPLNEDVIRNLNYIYHAQIETAIAPGSEIQKAIQEYYHPEKTAGRGKESRSDEKVTLTVGDADSELEDEGNVVSTFNYIMSHAVKDGASDIHIEPRERSIRVRFRVDGILQHKTDLPASIAQKLISRIKVLSGVDIAEKRRHQDGRIQARVLGNRVDLRVSVYAAVHGENVVIRVLHRQSSLLNLDQLGLTPANRVRFQKVLDEPSGTILVTGPTGSGKTTTLYAALNYLNDGERAIITVEDPVEYIMEGIVQGQLDKKVGQNFVDFLRSMMRQDPDVIMLGEIRDATAAEAAVQAALTGHKVLSTFHSDDATSALLRLMDMGIEAYLVSSTMSSVLSQRLVRILCPSCREAYVPPQALIDAYNFRSIDMSHFTFYRPVGCPECNDIGYRGRTAIHELLFLNESVSTALQKQKTAHELRTAARYTADLINMSEDGFYKATKGITSLEEVLRLVSFNESDEESARSAEEIIAICEGDTDVQIMPIDLMQPVTQDPIEIKTEPGATAGPIPDGFDREIFRMRLDAATIHNEGEQIADFFKAYQEILEELGKSLDSDLLGDFEDFITYTVKRLATSLKAEYVEFCICVKNGEVKILVETMIPQKVSAPTLKLGQDEGARLLNFLKPHGGQEDRFSNGKPSRQSGRSQRGKGSLVELLRQNGSGPLQSPNRQGANQSALFGPQVVERKIKTPTQRARLFRKHVEELELAEHLGGQNSAVE